MKGSQTLAGYDMVLTLSENTINYQFKQLHKLNIIHKKWAVLAEQITDGDKDMFYITDSDASYNAKLNRWIDLQGQIAQAKEDNEWTEVGKLNAALEEEKVNFKFGWKASLLAPKINILEKDRNSLTLQIIFKSGQLYDRPGVLSRVNTIDLKNAIYAFQVPIGQLKIDKEAMILDAGEQVTKIIRESGLSEQDFTIESLFLNFSDANISNFDRTKSSFPAEATTPLQRAVENYFNLILKDSENPYILGYGLRRKRIKASDKAMFQPSSLGFTTSYSNHANKKGQFSGLNYLMMLNDTAPPTDPNAGILPQSLIEFSQDTTSTTDGVFALQYDHFKTYIASIDSYIQKTFSDLEGVTVTSPFNNGSMKAEKHDKHIDDTIDSVYTVTREGITSSTSSSITIRYKIEVAITVKIIAWVLEMGEQKLSTAGPYTKGDVDKPGAPGYLDFTVKTGKTGRFSLEHTLTSPTIGFDKNPNLFEGDFLKVFLNIVLLVFTWYISVIQGIITQIAVDLGKESVTSNSALIEKLNDLDVLNQSNKIILPLGKIYTFKNLKYRSEQDVVSYDIAYAPVVEQ
ncbi:MAG: hypothetical protein AAFO03_15930 [Bacteroidota bacterium]